MAHESVRIIDYAAIGLISLAMGLLLCLPTAPAYRDGEASQSEASLTSHVPEASADAGASRESSANPTGFRGNSNTGADSIASDDPAYKEGKIMALPNLYDVSEGVAVTVNGVAVGEAAVRWVEDALGQSAQGAAVRPKALRSAAVDYLTGLEALRQEAASRGLSVGEDDVRRDLADIRASFASEEDYSRYLHDRGVTEEALALGLESELLSARLMAQVVPEGDVRVSDLAVLERLQPERAAAIAVSGDEGAAVERAAATELEKLDAAQVADARAYLRQQERTRLFLEWLDTLEDASDIE